MENRYELILSSVVKEYVDLAIPISSLLICEKYEFGLSPATIRAVMLDLENDGYLYQPHTSAGRIPTDKGFRYFVDALMSESGLTIKEQKSLQLEALKLKAQNKMLARTAAKLLSVMSGNLAISGVIDSEDYYKSGLQNLLSQPEFSNLDSVCKVAEVIDYLDESVNQILGELEDKSEIEVFIGKENPISCADECSMIVSKCDFEGGEQGLLAIIGPKRMKYSHNVSLIDYLKKVLGNK